MKFRLLLILSMLLLVSKVVNSQEDIYKKIEPVYISETQNDSIDLICDFYSVYDSLAVFFEGDTLYENFDNEMIHYPKVDFSNKLDTTIISLIDITKGNIYTHPFKGEVTSRFGLRRYRYHYGTDVNLETGDSILCAFDGRVRVTKKSRSYGYVVVVRHLNGLETLYAHLSQINVFPEQLIKAGDLIGFGGNTGRSRGSHLHFETRYLGAPINPEDIIDFSKYKLISDTLYLSKFNFRYQSEIAKLKQARFHKVKRGETLGSIAKKYHTTVAALRKLNKLGKKSLIREGKRIRVR